MTREEFTERVGLNVSDGIFEVWNGVYMSSDKDKDDEFYKKYAEECEKRYALERKLEQIMNLINA